MDAQSTSDIGAVKASDSADTEKRKCSRPVPGWKKLAFKSLWLLLYPEALLTADFMRTHPDTAERFYASGFFPPVRSALGAVFSVFPFSFAEFLLYSLIAALLVFAVVCIVLAVRRKLPFARFLSWLLTILIIGGAGLNAFYWLWGFNYYRETLASRMALDTEEGVTTDELREMCLELAEDANALRSQVSEDGNGVFRYDEGGYGILSGIPAAYGNLGERESVFSGRVYPPKPVLASAAMSDAGIAGIFIPFTEEANVNMDTTPVMTAFSAAHEAAHSLGIAREEEANFAAYLACMASDDPQIRYSGTVLALIYAGNALSSADPAAYSDLWDHYSDGLVRDLEANNEHQASHEGKVSEAASDMNDRYLQGHGQSSGVASYGEMVDLLAAYWKKNGLPVYGADA